MHPLTDRQELFCRHVARGASGAAAARWAGYATDSAAKQASVMLDRPHIRSRIEDLKVKREIARQTGVAEMVDRLRALAKLSIAKGDYRTVMRSIEFEARLTGLIPEKHAASPCGGFAGADPLLDGIDPRPPRYAAACAEAWVEEWRSGLEPEPEETSEPVIVPHVWDGFEGRPLDDFTPDTDLERAGLPPRDAPQKGMKGKEKEGFTAADLAAFEAAFGKEGEEEEDSNPLPRAALSSPLPRAERSADPGPTSPSVPPQSHPAPRWAPAHGASAPRPGKQEEEAPIDPIASREASAEAKLEAELAYLRSIAPPVAINPAAPAWARHPDPLSRGAMAELKGGWNPDWEKPG